MRRAQIRQPRVHERLFSGDFDKPSIAALCSTARRNFAVKLRRSFRPHQHLATITSSNGIGVDTHIFADVRGTGILFHALALPITPDQRRAASTNSRDIHAGMVKQADLVTEHFDRTAALSRRRARCVKCSGHTDDTGCAAAQPNFTIARPKAAGANNSIVVQDGGQQGILGLRIHYYTPAIGHQ